MLAGAGLAGEWGLPGRADVAWRRDRSRFPWLAETLAALRHPDRLSACRPPARSLQGTLRPYAAGGVVEWLYLLAQLKLGAWPRRRHGAWQDHARCCRC